MSTISVSTNFCAGHRILGLNGQGAKCRNPHGHSFRVTWVFEQSRDDIGLEFGELKMRLRRLIDAHFDHSFIVDIHDDFCHYLDVNQLKHYQLDRAPTTEAIAAEIADLTIDRMTQSHEDPSPTGTRTIPALFPNAKLLKVILKEGPDNCATWEADLLAGTVRLDPATWLPEEATQSP